MDKEFITIRPEREEKPPIRRERKEQPRERISLRAKLVIILLAVLFVALNGVGYYLYRQGYFSIGADITPQDTPAEITEEGNRRDTIFMIPEAL